MKKQILIISILCLLLNNTTVAHGSTFVNPSAASTIAATVKTNLIAGKSAATNKKDTKDSDNEKKIKSLWPKNEPKINSEAAIVMEASTGAILYSKNMHKTYYPASITKVLTALLAIENSNLGETVKFSKKAIYDVDLDSSRIGIDVDEELTMEQCLYGLMLESANEVAYAIAEHVSGTVDSFASLMNKKAKDLGCEDSHFVNPHGLPDPDHYTSVYDMALISRAAINNQIFRKITGTKTYAIPPTNKQKETRYLANHHKFIKGAIPYDGCIGGKTGYTSKAKYTLVTFAERNGMTLISVIMYCDSIPNEYADSSALLNYGFDNFSLYNIEDMSDPDTKEPSPLFTKYAPLFNKNTSNLQISQNGNIVLPNKANYKDAKKEIVLKPLNDFTKGDNVIGSVKYTYGGTYVGSADILYNNIQSESILQGAFIPSPTPSPAKDGQTGKSTSGSSIFKPVIIGIIIGIGALSLALYVIFVELPFRKKRSAYLEKKGRKRRYHKKDYIDF